MDDSSISMDLQAGRMNTAAIDGYVFSSTKQFNSMISRYRNCLTDEEVQDRANYLTFFDNYTYVCTTYLSTQSKTFCQLGQGFAIWTWSFLSQAMLATTLCQVASR